MPASFEVCGWAFGPTRDTLTLLYRVEHPTFGERLLEERIDLPVAVPTGAQVDRVIDLLAVAAGVSYFKVGAPESISFGPGLHLDTASTAAAEALYDEGMREFSFANALPLPRPIRLPAAVDAPVARSQAVGPMDAADQPDAGSIRAGLAAAGLVRGVAAGPQAVGPTEVAERPDTGPVGGGLGGPRLLIPIGAGRDSSLLVSVLAEGAAEPPLLLAIGDNPYARRVADAAGLDLIVAHRHIDPDLLTLNALGAMNGHVPVTAINSLIAAVVACATGCGSVVMANERSGSQPTRIVDGVAINHQYSKSFEFELLLQRALDPSGVRYFSALRPWGELPVAAAFATRGDAMLRAFMSCNRAFVRDPARRSDGWCGDCPKCRSVYLSLAPFLPPTTLAAIFGTDLLADPAQIDGFLALVDVDAKPFECVGEVDEARTALRMLAADPVWRSHPVVQAVTSASPPPSTADAFVVSTEHAVPADVLDLLAPTIGPDPALMARSRAALAEAPL